MNSQDYKVNIMGVHSIVCWQMPDKIKGCTISETYTVAIHSWITTVLKVNTRCTRRHAQSKSHACKTHIHALSKFKAWTKSGKEEFPDISKVLQPSPSAKMAWCSNFTISACLLPSVAQCWLHSAGPLSFTPLCLALYLHFVGTGTGCTPTDPLALLAVVGKNYLSKRNV